MKVKLIKQDANLVGSEKRTVGQNKKSKFKFISWIVDDFVLHS